MTFVQKRTLRMTQLETLGEEVMACRMCPRLVEFRERAAREKKRQFSSCDYWGKPVPGFGSSNPRLMVVGLAPDAHGGNRTGRVFTGDRSGDFLFNCLFKAGFSNQPRSRDRADGLNLRNAYVTACVKCAPPENKPTREELTECSSYLRREIGLLKNVKAILCLGRVAYTSTSEQLWEMFQLNPPVPRFLHGLTINLGRGLPALFASYHPSPRNTQTGKLTEGMSLKVLSMVRGVAG